MARVGHGAGAQKFGRPSAHTLSLGAFSSGFFVAFSGLRRLWWPTSNFRHDVPGLDTRRNLRCRSPCVLLGRRSDGNLSHLKSESRAHQICITE